MLFPVDRPGELKTKCQLCNFFTFSRILVSVFHILSVQRKIRKNMFPGLPTYSHLPSRWIRNKLFKSWPNTWRSPHSVVGQNNLLSGRIYREDGVNRIA